MFFFFFPWGDGELSCNSPPTVFLGDRTNIIRGAQLDLATNYREHRTLGSGAATLIPVCRRKSVSTCFCRNSLTGTISISNMSSTNRKHEPKKDGAETRRGYPCRQEGCQRTFKTAYNAKTHHDRAHAKLKYQCPLSTCSKTYASPYAAQDHHRRKHLGIDVRVACPQNGCPKDLRRCDILTALPIHVLLHMARPILLASSICIQLC
jgi:hypothetical protein